MKIIGVLMKYYLASNTTIVRTAAPRTNLNYFLDPPVFEAFASKGGLCCAT